MVTAPDPVRHETPVQNPASRPITGLQEVPAADAVCQPFTSSEWSDFPPPMISCAQPPQIDTVRATPRSIGSRGGYVNQFLHSRKTSRDMSSSTAQRTSVPAFDSPTQNGANAEAPPGEKPSLPTPLEACEEYDNPADYSDREEEQQGIPRLWSTSSE